MGSASSSLNTSLNREKQQVLQSAVDTTLEGFLNKSRVSMFNGMQNLPVKYFDTHKHGDIMSHYTNDIDTLRMLISQALPTLIQSSIVIMCVLGIMIYYSIPMVLCKAYHS